MMKKQIFTIVTALMFAVCAFTFTSCGSGSHEEAGHHEEGDHHDHSDAEMTTYQCPMDCEEGKTYKEAGACPVCKMELKEVAAAE